MKVPLPRRRGRCHGFYPAQEAQVVLFHGLASAPVLELAHIAMLDERKGRLRLPSLHLKQFVDCVSGVWPAISPDGRW